MRILRRRSAPFPLLVLASAAACALGMVGVGGCSGGKSGSDETAAAGANGANSALETGTGTAWVVENHPVFGTVSFAVPTDANVALTGATPADGVLALLAQYPATFGMADAKNEWSVLGTSVDDVGNTAIRFAQVSRGVTVDPGDWIAVVDSDGKLASMAGVYVPNVAAVDVTPTESAAAMMKIVEAHVMARLPGVTAADITIDVAQAPVIYADRATAPALVFSVSTSVQSAAALDESVYLVDAHSGVIVTRGSAIHSATASGYGAAHYAPYNSSSAPVSFPASDTKPPTLDGKTSKGTPINAKSVSFTPAAVKPITGSGLSNWTDSSLPAGAAVDAQSTLAVVADTYNTTFGRNAPDGKGGTVNIVLINSTDRDFLGLEAWNSNAGVIEIGPGFQATYGTSSWVGSDALSASPPANATLILPGGASLDLMAHEYTHGVSFYSWGGNRDQMSGSIDEAMSDVFGEFISGAVAGSQPTTIGRGLSTDASFYVRNLGVPHDPRGYPSTNCDSMSEYPQCASSDFDVHAGAGIASYAWYLMTFGGTHETNHLPIPCGLGWSSSKALWYDVETRGLHKTPDFKALANATLASAKTHKLPMQPVVCAWIAVGVLTSADAATWKVTCPAAAGGADGGAGAGASGADGGVTLVTTGATPLICTSSGTSLVK